MKTWVARRLQSTRGIIKGKEGICDLSLSDIDSQQSVFGFLSELHASRVLVAPLPSGTSTACSRIVVAFLNITE